MKKFLVILAVVLAGCSAILYQSDEPLAMRRATSKSVLRVLSNDSPGGGSGFVIAIRDKKMLVTNEHVCGAPPFDLYAFSEQTREIYPLVPKAISEEADLCVAEIIGAEAIPTLTLARRNAEVGSTVFTLGYPLLRYLSLTTGQIQVYKNEYHLFFLNIWVMPGQSGSPVLNRDREVVGVIARKGIDNIHESAAVPISALHAVIEVLEKDLDKSNKSGNN